MQGKKRSHREASPGKTGSPLQNQEKQHRVNRVEQEIDVMMPGRAEPEQSTIQSVRETGGTTGKGVHFQAHSRDDSFARMRSLRSLLLQEAPGRSFYRFGVSETSQTDTSCQWRYKICHGSAFGSISGPSANAAFRPGRD